MYISKMAVKNFRNIEDITVELDRFNVIIGGNDVGKTNYCEALSKLFEFRSIKYIFDYSDFKDHSKPILIDVWFDDFTEEDKVPYHGLNLRDKIIHWQLQAQWNYEIGETEGSIEIVRDDQKEEERENEDLRYSHKEYFPFVLIPAYRTLDQEFRKWGDIPYIFKRDIPKYSKSLHELKNSIPEILEDNINSLKQRKEGEEIIDLVNAYIDIFNQFSNDELSYDNYLKEFDSIRKKIIESPKSITLEVE